MPFYLITLKADLESCKRAFEYLANYYHFNVKAVAFTLKPYPHAHAVVSCRFWLNAGRIHELIANLELQQKPYIHLRLLHSNKDVVKAIEYVKKHEVGDAGMSGLEERLERLERIVEQLVNSIQSQRSLAKDSQSEVGYGSELQLGKVKLKLKESKYNGRKLLVVETPKATAFLSLSAEDAKAIAQWLASNFGFKLSSRSGTGKKGIKKVKGYKNALW